MDHSVAAMEEIPGEIGTLRIWDLLTYFDDKYIKPSYSNNYIHMYSQNPNEKTRLPAKSLGCCLMKSLASFLFISSRV
jgi:hypothetical protein